MTSKKIKGFTLIELLVVVAIIGVLATVVLASLGRARIKAKDTAVVSAVSSYITDIELEYGGNYTGLCSGSSYLALLDAVQEDGGDIATGDCEDSSGTYRIIATLPSATAFLGSNTVYAAGEDAYCINSNGFKSKGMYDDFKNLAAPSCSLSESGATANVVYSWQQSSTYTVNSSNSCYRRREYYCQDSNGNTVADSNCPGTKPVANWEHTCQS